MILLLTALAFGHGGEDHDAPAPPVTATSAAESVSTWSTEFDAVVRLPYAAPGEELHGTLLIADHNTNAPLPAGQITLSFAGPAAVQAHVEPPTQPGIYPFTAILPAHGHYTGSLQVMTADRADLLGLPELHYEAPIVEAHEDGWGWGWIAAGVAGGVGLGVMVGLLAGFGAGRLSRKAAPAALIGMLTLWEGSVHAHGGDEHEAPPAPETPVAVGGGLALVMESQFLLGVRTAVVRQEALATSERLVGKAVIRSGGGAEIAAPLTGTVELAEGVSPGMAVTKGQVLATIRESLGGAERADVLASRTGAQTQVARARQELALAERDAERAEQLGGVISDRERLDRTTKVAAAREAVRQAEIAAGGIGSTSIALRAPVDGRIGSIGARPGEVVAQGAPLFTVIDDGPLWIEASLPEAVAGRLTKGAAASVTVEARPGEVLSARVLDPGLAADPRTGRFLVTLALDDPHEGLRPGMTVTGWVTVGEARDVLVIPEDAVVESGGETLVFVKTAPEAFAERPVALGASSAGRREVLSGLQAGDRVVVDGTYALRSLAGR